MGRPEQSLYSHFQRLFGPCLALVFVSLAYSQSATDASLNAVRISDRADRAANGKLAPQITATEHMRRAGIYLANRAFAPAREHWQAVLDNYPNDVNVPAALYGMALRIMREPKDAEDVLQEGFCTIWRKAGICSGSARAVSRAIGNYSASTGSRVRTAI